MDELKTDLKELKKFTEPLDRSKTITLGGHKTFAFREFKTVWLLHDTLLAHTFQADLKSEREKVKELEGGLKNIIKIKAADGPNVMFSLLQRMAREALKGQEEK